jgi:hypothetical protein
MEEKELKTNLFILKDLILANSDFLEKNVLNKNYSIEELKNKIRQKTNIIENTLISENTPISIFNKIEIEILNIISACIGVLILIKMSKNLITKEFTTGYPLDFGINDKYINDLILTICENHFKRIKMDLSVLSSLSQVYQDYSDIKNKYPNIDYTESDIKIDYFIKNNLISVGYINYSFIIEEIKKQEIIRKNIENYSIKKT